MSEQGILLLKAIREEIVATDVTNKTYQTGYPAISPKRVELSQKGRTILITGGGQGVGFAIAKSFIAASASKLIIVGRRLEVLESAAQELRAIAKGNASNGHTDTEIVVRSCDIADVGASNKFWRRLAEEGTGVDVLVHSAIKISQPEPILKLGAGEIWSQFETNLKATFLFAEQFIAQNEDAQRFIVDVSTAQIHGYRHALTIVRPAYTLSKTAQHMYFQLLADEIVPNRVQIVSYHPGQIYNDAFAQMGVPKEGLDDDSLPGDCAVWMASKEAEFLHGRMIWSSWNVEELKDGPIRRRIDEDEYFLRVGLGGLNKGLITKT